MKSNFALSILLSISPIFALAHHPNEGPLTLDELQMEAHRNNREIKAAEQNSLSSESLANERKSSFMPQVSIEGGPMSARFDEEKNSGTAVYGKAEWNLYSGGKDYAELKKAETERDLEKRKLESVKARVSREVSRLYYEMLYLLESIAIKEQALQMNQEQMKLAQAKRNSGLTSQADVLEFELRESTLHSDLKLLQQQRAATARELSYLIGVTESPEALSVKGHLETETLGIDKTKALHHFAAGNLEILEAHTQAQIASQEKNIARSSFLPKLDLEAQYGRLANEERVFDQSNNYRFFLKLNIPLFSGLGSYYDFSASQSRSAQKEIELQSVQTRVRSELEGLLSELSSIDERIRLEEKNLMRSENYYKMTIAEYKRGVKNSPDVVGASERIIEAKIRNLEFRKDYQITKLKIYDKSGAPAQGL